MNSNLTGNINVKQAVPFFMVTNIQKSIDFYTTGLRFAIKHQWEPAGKIEWCWLQLDNASLMLQEFLKTLLNEKLGEGVSIYFICEDSIAIYNHIISNGLAVADPFVGNNMWVVALSDPDGYKIFFESPTDVPEETTYSDWIKNKDV